jgi:hypothetical protein
MVPAEGLGLVSARHERISIETAQAFMLVGYPIMPALVGVRETGAADHRFVTPHDFQSASVFEVVKSTRT